MGAQKGKDLLLKVDQAGGTNYQAVAGLRTKRIAFNAETVEITDAESAGRWRELLSGAGVQRASISGAGIFKDAASDASIRQLFFEGRTAPFEVTVPDFGRIVGPFQIAALEYSGEFNGEVTFEMTLESAGALAFVAI